jgi:hypothetical protein
MHRRLLIAALGCTAALHIHAQTAPPGPHLTISLRELRNTLAAQFPVRAELGLLELQVNAAGLALLPSRQRLGVTLSARVTDSSSRRVYTGEMDLVFAMRYERPDRTLRAYGIEVAALRMPGVPPEALETWEGLLTGFSRDAIDGIILHRFSRRELAVPDSLGLEPGKITVEDRGLDLSFVPRALR